MFTTTARRSALGIAVVSLVLGASAPAFARTPVGYMSDGSAMRFDAKTGNYCLSTEVTGSRLAKVTCQSQDAWAADGLTISRK